nr:MAG TPA: hypothetical protein [Caudoviricetes sp.]
MVFFVGGEKSPPHFNYLMDFKGVYLWLQK